MTETAIPSCAPPDPEPRPPRFAMPAGAIDTHAHLFGPAEHYPYSPGRGYTPPDAPLVAYDQLHRRLGVARGVLTQPSVYGIDNRLILDSIAQNRRRLRAIVAVAPEIEDRELLRMNVLGVRGIRINLVDKGGNPYDSIAEIERMARRILTLNWHIEFLLRAHEFANMRYILGALPVEVSIGHFGYMPTALGIDHPAFQDLLALMREGRCWVKLSGSYRITGEQRPPYADVVPFAQALVAARPDRILWGTDWPHPIVKIPMPNDGDLLDQLANWVPDAETRRRILVDNPAALYGFD